MKKIVASVIIPVYNGERYLKEAIESVLAQTYQDFEIIIIDDGSIDSSTQIIKDYQKKHPNKIFFYGHKKNRGCPAIAKNSALNHAKGKYIAFLDQDDVWLRDKLKLQLNMTEKKNNFIANFTNGYIVEAKTGKILSCSWDNISAIPNGNVLMRVLLNQNFILSSSSALIRWDILKKVGGFDQKMKSVDDYDLWIRLSRIGQLTFLNKPLYKWRLHEKNLTHNAILHINDSINLFDNLLKENLCKDEQGIIKRRKYEYFVRKANFYLENNNSITASKFYREAIKQYPNFWKARIILILSRLSPNLARFLISKKRNISAKRDFVTPKRFNL